MLAQRCDNRVKLSFGDYISLDFRLLISGDNPPADVIVSGHKICHICKASIYLACWHRIAGKPIKLKIGK
jgi:hypothetical protein